MSDTNQRLTDLEIRLAHHEQMVEELSDVIARQDRVIDMMSLKLHRLIERLRAVETGRDASPQDDKPPPHY